MDELSYEWQTLKGGEWSIALGGTNTTATFTTGAIEEDWAGMTFTVRCVIIYPGVAAKEMCNTIEATVYNANGEAISVTLTDNVRAYVMRNLTKWDAQTCSMGVDMLNYGAAAQQQLTYNTIEGYAARNAHLPICGAVMQFVDGAYAYLH